MTVRLFDVQQVKQYGEDRLAFEEECRERSQGAPEVYTPGKPMKPWPVPPMPPEAMVDSRDRGQEPGGESLAVAFTAQAFRTEANVASRDFRPANPIDVDGTSQQDVEGYESTFSAESGGSDPFKTRE